MERLRSCSATAPTAFHLIALEPDGEMLVGVADMRVYNEISPSLLRRLPAALWTADAVFADCNLPTESLAYIAAQTGADTKLAINGVSPAKVKRAKAILSDVDFLFVNLAEAAALVDGNQAEASPEAMAEALLARGVEELVITLGAAGFLAARLEEKRTLEGHGDRVKDVTGAGDALAATYLDRVAANKAAEEFLMVQSEVAEALAAGRPVVALESTIITHGMPSPQNVETALAVAQDVRAGGAVPATIAILEGRIRVGLTEAELRQLASLETAAKVSRADLPAALAGIRVFATGGIGGVHRGAEVSFDVSADLQELARSPVAVVCAGAKAILDLPKTLEVLETLGVPVITHGSDAFPAFYSRDSGLPTPLRCDSPTEIAAVMANKWRLGLGGGLVVANPIPQDAEIPAAIMEEKIALALSEAEAEGIQGKAVTPFLLARLEALTQGESLAANVALVRNNARLAAAIAAAYGELSET